jgi:hypothetical protein
MFFTFSHTSNNSHKGITDGQVLYSLKSLCNSFASCSHTVAAAERKRVGKGENKHLWLEKMTISVRHMWKLYVQFHSHCSRIYDIKTLYSKHKTNCKCITLHTNTTIYRTIRGMPSCAIVSAQEHYCQMCKCPCKNTTLSCTTVHARTLLSAVQVSMQEHCFQLCKSQCKNTSISCATVNTRTLLSAV